MAEILLEELKITYIQPTDISHNPVHRDRTKHVKVDRHFIKENIEERVIYITYVPISQQGVDFLTKGLVKSVFERLVDKLGMFNVFCPS